MFRNQLAVVPILLVLLLPAHLRAADQIAPKISFEDYIRNNVASDALTEASGRQHNELTNSAAVVLPL